MAGQLQLHNLLLVINNYHHKLESNCYRTLQ